MHRQHALASAISAAAGAPGILPMRVVAPKRSMLAALGQPSNETVGLAVAAAVDTAKSDPSPEAQHAAGLSCLLAGAPADATRYLDAAARGKDDAVFWTHLAVGQYAMALRDRNDEYLLFSLGALSHALALEPERPEAAYNFALAVEQLGVLPAASRLWTSYLHLSDSKAWKGDAARRRETIAQRVPDNNAWKLIVQQKRDVAATLGYLSLRFPQQARLWAENSYLCEWAAAVQRRDRDAADRALERARSIGDALRRNTGESLVSEAVAAIDRAIADGDNARQKALSQGHLHYDRGRALSKKQQLRKAEEEFLKARDRLAAGHSPMAAVASALASSILHDMNHFAESRERAGSLLAEEDRQHPTHYALRAQLQYQLARTDAIRGLWSDSLAEALESQALYRRLRESGNEAVSVSLIAEAYDYIGQPAVAIRYGLQAIRMLADTGDTYKLRVAAANLCRASMRRQLWDTAHALIRIERLLEPLTQTAANLSGDTSMRAAIIEQSLGRTAASDQELRQATQEAAQLEPEARASLLADISGTRGALMRRRNPARAVQLLGQAIAYQETTERAILLPQLYLERGRAQLDLHREEEALADFERGMQRLELLRSHLSEARLRYGIFDDSHELFAEAIALHLRRGEREEAFTIVERGRARALLEQIAGTPAPSPPPELKLAAVHRALPPGTLLVEYAALRDRLLLFVIGNDSFDMRSVPVDADTVAAKSAVLVSALVDRKPLAEVKAAAADMHALLLQPVPELARYERLILVPDAALQQIPFAALFDPKAQQFFVEQHLFVTSPSLAISLQSSRRNTHASRKTAAAIFVGARAAPSLALRRLPEAENEAAAIAGKYQRSMLFRSADASVERFLQEAPKYDVVHFGGHALIDAGDPAQSALVMSSRGAEPGLLHCSQIGTARFQRARLVVLAACSTMRGRTGRADGTPSIARSFLAAGVPAVVGTLWDVDDAETSTLIIDFHQSVASGLSPAAALRQAQLAALHSHYEEASHPGSWAAFSILGAGGL